MATQTPQPVIHIYKEVNKGKYRSVKHFELVEVLNGTPKLTTLINISKNRNCALSMPEYWLKIKQGKNWDKKCLTGLFKTSIRNLYKGDHNKRKHLILFKFDEVDNLLIYYFENYFTNDISTVLPLINLLTLRQKKRAFKTLF